MGKSKHTPFLFSNLFSRRLVLLPHWVPFEVEVGEGLEERSGSLTGRNGRIDSKYKEKKYKI